MHHSGAVFLKERMTPMQEQIISWLGDINGFLWNYIIIALLVLGGLWFTYAIKFAQVREIPEMIKLLVHSAKSSGNHGENGISAFQAFCVSVASHVGVGNIAGIAIAVSLGGPGAVFWMWFIAIVGAATSYVENTLGQIYKVKFPDGSIHGGPAYYITHGLKSPMLGIMFAILISITYGLIYNSVQANTIALSMKPWNIDATYVGIAVAILTVLVIFGGMKRIARVSELLVPFMATLYILIALYVVLANITIFPSVIASIFTEAFNFQSATGGFLGAAMLQGIKRGLFSNEAGEGSVPNAAATAEVCHPARQGLLQAFGVFVDTMLVCTASAFIVLVSGNYQTTNLRGIELVQHDLAFQLGSWAPAVLAFFIFMFAFSSIIGNYYYGEINISHLSKNKTYLQIFRIAVVVMVFIGSIASLDLVWNLADLFMAFLILTNVTSILRLGKLTTIALKDYLAQKKAGVQDPTFDASILPLKDGIDYWPRSKQ